MKARFCITLLAALAGFSPGVQAQNVGVRSNAFDVDFSEGKKLVSTTVPVVNWISPVPEINYAPDIRYKISVEVTSTTAIKAISIIVRESAGSVSRGMVTIIPDSDEKLHKNLIEKNITLMEGPNLVEVVAENADGIKTTSQRSITVGMNAFADAGKLDRSDYAIVFTTNDYDNWPDLTNPVNDGRMIAAELKNTYGFQVEVMEGGSQTDILKKLREYAEKKYKPLDQLLIFFAGHGQFDQTFGEGYVVTRESLSNDEAKTTYLSHNRLRSIINNIPVNHILLAMDVCFGGTFDAAIAHRGQGDATYKEATQSEMVIRKLTYKTRRYLTSGGKEYVPDGRPGMNSPFARKLLEAFRSRGGADLILTMGELELFVEPLQPQPRAGEFGDNAPGSDFIFIGK